MSVVCTSCGVSIPLSSIIYKCHQCVHHFVCELCEKKEHNQACIHFHTLNKIHPSQIQSSTISSVASNTLSNSFDDQDKTTNQISSKSSSIFSSEEFLYNLLANCSHCDRIVVMSKEATFQCQQCPKGFGVCADCKPLMITHHPSAHRFSQKSLDDWAREAYGYFHLNVTCNGCSRKHFHGNRRQCEECPLSFDLCDDCFGKKHREHQMKYIQNPLLYNHNRGALARRVLSLAEKNGASDSNWRDSMTGWTKADAELIDQQVKQENDNYYTQSQQICKNDQRPTEQFLSNTQRLQDKVSDSWRRLSRDLNYRKM